MNPPGPGGPPAAPPTLPALPAMKRRSLLRRYVVALLVVVSVPLAGYAVLGVWVTAAEQRAALAEIQRVHAAAAAQQIAQFVREVEGQLRWLTHLPWSEGDAAQHRLDALRLLRQAPSVTDLTLLDGAGRERLFVSRLSLDRRAAGGDRSAEAAVRGALEAGAHFGPVYFRRGNEPFMSLAVAGTRPGSGVVIAEINLAYTRDVVAAVRVGRGGRAYVVDRGGRLVAHPEASLVLRNTDLSGLLQRIDARPDAPLHRLPGAAGEPAVLAQAVAPPLDWRVLVELPQAEADEPLRRALARTLWIAAASLVAAVAFALLLSWRMTRPIRVLADGAARLGTGALEHRIAIDTGDELQRLGEQFNAMAGELQRSYAGLELKVAERTRELTEANLAKSRFVAAASHDLRQPLHALNLLVAQLRGETDARERERLAERIESAVASINALFADLLDISKLDAGVVAPRVAALPLQPVLDRMAATFAPEAQARGLRLVVRPHRGWVRSDPVLLERIVANLVGNALRYTRRGGVLVGCRRRGGALRLEVWDTGIGIAPEQHGRIFDEFVQVAPAGALRGEGLGLGLAIVSRLARLLGHGIGLNSQPGRGSCFAVTLPAVAEPEAAARPAGEDEALPQPLRGHAVLVVDNDPDVLASTGGLLRQWGLNVRTAASVAEVAAALEPAAPTAANTASGTGAERPDLVIADLHLGDAAEGTDGLQAIALARAAVGAALPALVVSGDVSPAARERVAAAGLTLVEKPVPPLRLRALVTRALQR